MYLYSRSRLNILVHVLGVSTMYGATKLCSRDVKTAFQAGFNRTDAQEVIRKPSSSSSLIYHVYKVDNSGTVANSTKNVIGLVLGVMVVIGHMGG